MPDIDSLRPMYAGAVEYPAKVGKSSTMAMDAQDSQKPGVGEKGEVKPTRRFPEEEDEELLRESEDRFVLFPIKYREVCSEHHPPAGKWCLPTAIV